jgi:RNA polymerase subunit RPABC4/transcription elongation factor Spt4
MSVKVGGRIADDTGVSDQDDVRCPHCGALLRAGSPWCTLCFTDLRPAPEPVAVTAVREPSYAGAPAPSADFDPLTFDPLTAPLSVVEAGGHAPTVDAAPAAASEDAKPTGWPCPRCDEIVAFDEAACPKCGTAFLAGATGQPDLLERLGSRGISTSTQVGIIVGGSFALIAVIVGFMYFIGLFL